MIALKPLDEGDNPPPTYQEIRCHMIFDMKMEYLRQKYRCVAGGHATVAPPTLTYARVVWHDIVRIAIMFTVLNDLEVKISYTQNAYLTAPCLEKICTTLGS